MKNISFVINNHWYNVKTCIFSSSKLPDSLVLSKALGPEEEHPTSLQACILISYNANSSKPMMTCELAV